MTTAMVWDVTALGITVVLMVVIVALLCWGSPMRVRIYRTGTGKHYAKVRSWGIWHDFGRSVHHWGGADFERNYYDTADEAGEAVVAWRNAKEKGRRTSTLVHEFPLV